MQGFNLSIALAIALSLLPLGALAVAGDDQSDHFAIIERRLDLTTPADGAPLGAVSFTHLDAAEGMTFNAIARNALKGEGVPEIEEVVEN